MIELKDYQKEAVENLHQKIDKSLRSSENEVIVFQAPTGSGKTVMVSALLKEIASRRKDDKKFSFVWVSVRMLHSQSKEKLEKFYEDDRTLKCSYFEDLEDRKIGENEILFINWHSINKKDINIFVKENEKDNNLSNIIKNTKEDGRAIILIIDESHHTAGSEKSKELIRVEVRPGMLARKAVKSLRNFVSSSIQIKMRQDSSTSPCRHSIIGAVAIGPFRNGRDGSCQRRFKNGSPLAKRPLFVLRSRRRY